jgi:hypothetical protein
LADILTSAAQAKIAGIFVDHQIEVAAIIAQIDREIEGYRRPAAIGPFRSRPGSRRCSRCGDSIRPARSTRAIATCSGRPPASRSRASNGPGRRAVLKAHGQNPAYVSGTNLSPESRAALKAIDLHFHDLRREAGSRWLDAGLPLHQVQVWLGHTNIAQTSTYLAVTDDGGSAAMERFDKARTEAPAAKPEADDAQPDDQAEAASENLQETCKAEGEMWSGRVDSNHRPLGPEPSALPG